MYKLAPQPEYTVSGCYGHSCGELWRALLAVAVAWNEGWRRSCSNLTEGEVVA